MFLAPTPEWAGLIAAHGGLAAWIARLAERPSFKATAWEQLAELAAAG